MDGQRSDGVDAEWLTNQIAHAVRNSLFGMMVHLEVLEQRAAADPAFGRGVAAVLGQVRRLESAVEAMLLYGRPAQPQTRSADASTVLEDAAHEARAGARGAPVEVTVRAAEGLGIEGDPQLLRTVLDRLLDNVVQHTPAPHRVTLLAEAADGEVVVRVRDEGPGIPPDLAEKALLPFVPQHGGRLGLGLAIAEKLTRAQGGRLELSSTPDAGTTVSLYLPRARG